MNNSKEKRSAMIAIIEDGRSRGRSKKQYCLEKGINQAKFYWYWSIETGSFPHGFIDIQKPSGASEIEVVYPNGSSLKSMAT